MKEKQNIEESIWSLIGKYLAGEATPSEAKQVDLWCNQSEESRAELENSVEMLEKIDDYYHSKKFNAEAAWKKVQTETGGLHTKTVQLKTSRKEVFARFYKYAAVILVAITLSVAGYYLGVENLPETSNYEVISGENQVVNEYILPDGSLVALNSNSKLTFPKKFKNDVREVTVTGEAFFDVEPNPGKPFIIHAGNAQVKVVGTTFNVRAYPENERVEVIVKTGKVYVSLENESGNGMNEKPEIILNQGEKGVVFKNSLKTEKSVNSDINFLAWKTQKLVFTETPLSDVVKYLEGVYHIEIQLEGEDLNNLPLTATFNKKPIDFVLNVIQLTFNLELIKEKNDLFVFSNRKNEEVKL